MAILALMELDCIKMDWKKVENDNQFFCKDNCKLQQSNLWRRKTIKINSHMAANFANHIFEIKISPPFANDKLFLCLSKA